MRAAGDAFEARACTTLEAAGLRLLARNFNTRYGELDLVMLEGSTIVFVEVRYRKTASHGDAATSVTASKQAKLIKAAQQWLAQHPHYAQRPCRFDVMGYDGPVAAVRNEWFRGAFDAG
jgi:putative endonuclease